MADDAHLLLLYQYVADMAERRGPYREAHLQRIRAEQQAGRVTMAGALGSPPSGAAIVFKGVERDQVEQFVASDPYLEAGLVTSWSVEPWKTFDILSDIERDAGRPAAAFEARRRAIEAYLAYRRDGGESQTGGMTAQLCEDLLGAVQSGQVETYLPILDQLQARADKPTYLAPVLTALRAVLAGTRDPALADDPALDYDDAAEILMLLERLRAFEQHEA